MLFYNLKSERIELKVKFNKDNVYFICNRGPYPMNKLKVFDNDSKQSR